MKKAIIALFIAIIILVGYFLLTKPAVAPAPETEPVTEEQTSASATETVNTSGMSSENYRIEGATVDTSTLGEGQQQLLQTFGIEGDIEITPEMIACAEEKIDKERLDEIIAGATPSFMEGVALAGCY